MFKRSRISRIATAVLVVTGLLFGGAVAIAAEGTGPVATRQTDGAGRPSAAPHRPLGKFAAWVFASTVEFLDLPRGQVVSALARGETLAEIAVASGSSGEELAAALMADAEARLDQAVTDGRITEEQRGRLLERLTAAIDAAVFEPHHPGDHLRDRVRDHRRGAPRMLWKTTLEFLDVNWGDVVSTFAAGGTLADLAAEQGSSGEALVDELVSVLDARLSEAVVDGRITEEQKEEMLEEAAERITDFVFSQHHPGRGNRGS